LSFNFVIDMAASRKKEAESLESTANAVKTRATSADKTVLLQSCEAEVQMPSGKMIQARVFIDGGSQKSFVTRDFVKRAGLRPYGSQ
jgi:hypothetical protein